MLFLHGCPRCSGLVCVMDREDGTWGCVMCGWRDYGGYYARREEERRRKRQKRREVVLRVQVEQRGCTP